MLIDKLNEKIDALLQTLQSQKTELQELRLRVTALATQNAEKDHQISQLYEQLSQKDSELQRTIDKIQFTLKNEQ